MFGFIGKAVSGLAGLFTKGVKAASNLSKQAEKSQGVASSPAPAPLIIQPAQADTSQTILMIIIFVFGMVMVLFLVRK